MSPFNGNTNPILKVALLAAALLTLFAIIVTRDWSNTFRESGISAETMRSNSVRIDRNEAEIQRLRAEYVTKEAFLDLQRRMDRFEATQQKILDLIVEERARGRR